MHSPYRRITAIEKVSPSERGFDLISSNHLPSRIHSFFSIRLIPLIFDIEITMSIPFVFLTASFNL